MESGFNTLGASLDALWGVQNEFVKDVRDSCVAGSEPPPEELSFMTADMTTSCERIFKLNTVYYYSWDAGEMVSAETLEQKSDLLKTYYQNDHTILNQIIELNGSTETIFRHILLNADLHMYLSKILPFFFEKTVDEQKILLKDDGKKPTLNHLISCAYIDEEDKKKLIHLYKSFYAEKYHINVLNKLNLKFEECRGNQLTISNLRFTAYLLAIKTLNTIFKIKYTEFLEKTFVHNGQLGQDLLMSELPKIPLEADWERFEASLKKQIESKYYDAYSVLTFNNKKIKNFLLEKFSNSEAILQNYEDKERLVKIIFYCFKTYDFSTENTSNFLVLYKQSVHLFLKQYLKNLHDPKNYIVFEKKVNELRYLVTKIPPSIQMDCNKIIAEFVSEVQNNIALYKEREEAKNAATINRANETRIRENEIHKVINGFKAQLDRCIFKTKSYLKLWKLLKELKEEIRSLFQNLADRKRADTLLTQHFDVIMTIGLYEEEKLLEKAKEQELVDLENSIASLLEEERLSEIAKGQVLVDSENSIELTDSLQISQSRELFVEPRQDLPIIRAEIIQAQAQVGNKRKRRSKDSTTEKKVRNSQKKAPKIPKVVPTSSINENLPSIVMPPSVQERRDFGIASRAPVANLSVRKENLKERYDKKLRTKKFPLEKLIQIQNKLKRKILNNLNNEVFEWKLEIIKKKIELIERFNASSKKMS